MIKKEKKPHNIFNAVLLQKRATEDTEINLSTICTKPQAIRNYGSPTFPIANH